MASTSSIVYSPAATFASVRMNAVEADVIADEVRRVLGNHDAFAQTMVGKMRHCVHDLRQGLRRRNHFEQMQISRRVEEVRAEPVLSEVVAAPFGERRNRNTRGVRLTIEPVAARHQPAAADRA